MAWQLIYTSAPRLLEAGRSGFGTVARHRAIHPLLVTTLERDSQFDRGAAVGRVIFAHRILTAAGTRCHVLTCIRDAGADYTGRTNHIAHHLIIEPREIAALGSAAPTPADVFREMSWRPAWPESPRWLDGADEIPLSHFHRRASAAGAWQTATGDARRAALLQPAGSAVLIVPPVVDALSLFAESLAAAPAQAWQATFTTCLQPSDDLGEFRWLALAASSPQRDRAEAGRTVLDLTAPHTLPLPPTLPAMQAAPVPDALRTTPFAPTKGSATKPIGSLFDEALAVHGTLPSRPRRLGLWLGLAGATLAVAAAVVFFVLPKLRESPEVTARRAGIRDNVRAAFSGNDNGIADQLAGVPDSQLAAAIALASAAHDTADALRQPTLLPPLADAKSAGEQANKVGLNPPQMMSTLFALHRDFYDHQQKIDAIEKAPAAPAQVTDLQAIHAALGSYDKVAKEDSMPLWENSMALRKRLTERVEKLWPERLRALLKAKDEPTEKPEWFEKQHSDLPQTLKERAEAKEIHSLLDGWRLVNLPQPDQGKLLAIINEEPGIWPAWLIREANKKISVTQFLKTPDAPSVNPKQMDPGKAPPTGPRFEGGLMIVLAPGKPGEWQPVAVELQKSGTELRLKKPGADGDGDKLVPLGNGFGLNANDPRKEFVWNENKEFFADSGAPAPPYELRLLRDGKCLLTAWVTAAGNGAALRVVDGGLQRDKALLRITNSEARDLCKEARTRGTMEPLAKPPRRDGGTPHSLGRRDSEVALIEGFARASMVLELPTSCSPQLPPEKHRIPVEADGAASLEGITTALNNRINTEKEINKNQQAIADGKTSQRLGDALAPINKAIEVENNARHEAAKKELKKNNGKQPSGTVVNTPILSHPIKPADFGNHLKSYGNSTEYEGLFNVGERLLKPGANEPLISIIPSAREAADKAISRWKSRLGEGKNDEEKKSLKSIRDQNIARLGELRELLDALQNEAELGKAAAKKAADSQKILDALKDHPLHKKDMVPPGEYRLLIQPSANAPWLTLVLFKAP